MPEWLKYLLSFLTGAAGSLLAPWAHWGIEKRRIKIQQRIDTLKRFKSYLNEFGLDVINHRLAEFAQLRPHLDKSLVVELEGNNFRSLPEKKYHELKNRLINDIVRLERKWGVF